MFKIFAIIFTLIHIPLTIIALNLIDNNLLFFLIYSITSYFCVITCLREKADFTDGVCCFFFFMGFWTNPILNLILFKNNYFNYDTLTISIVVYLAITMASFISTNLNSNHVISQQNSEPLQIEFNRYPKLIIAIFMFFVFFISIFNLNYGIYQRGIESIGRFHSSIVSVFTLLINYGFLFYSVKLSTLILSDKNFRNKYYFIPVIIEQFLTSLSMLSRVMPINTLLILYGFEKRIKSYRLFIIYILLTVTSGIILISMVTTMRNVYHDLRNFEYQDFQKINFVKPSVINRFIGIDGVYYIKEYIRENPDSDLFKKMTFETRIKGVEPIYHEVMGLAPLNNDKINFVHIPGFVGYLSAGFNSITIFFIFTIFILIIKSVEVFVSKISYGDRMCGAIIAYFLVYRMTHSGIYVLDNYKLLLGICIILISYVSINTILNFKQKWDIL